MNKNLPKFWMLFASLALGPVALWLSAFAPAATARPDCAQPAPGLAQLAVQAAPDDWEGVFGRPDPCADRITFLDSAGTPIGGAPSVFSQSVARGILQFKVTPQGKASAVEACLPAADDEHFYGLGERFGSLDLAGQVLDNWTADQALERGQQTSYSPTPFLLSSRGYGLLLNTTARATFDLRIDIRQGYCVRVEADHLDLYLLYGPHPQTVIERHAQIVGLPPLPPEWAFGLWKNLIGGQARVEADVARLRAADVPVDALWIYDAVDERANFGWPWQVYGPIRPGAYPDLPGLIHRLHAQDLKVLGYLHHFIYPGSASFAEAAQRRYLIQTPDGQPHLEPWTFTPRGYVDFTNPEAAEWWQARVRYALNDLGFDGAMLDFGEAAPLDARYAGGQPGALMHNQYTTLYNRAAYQAGQSIKPDDFVFFARSGYSGSQAYTTGRFTGDQVRSWDAQKGLPSVIPGMLNGGLSGWPYWGPDIGGFFENGPVDHNETADARAQRLEAEKELWIRWVQLGALSPTMRDMLGSQTDPVGLWTDDETLAVFRAYARLHTALKPYLYHYARIAHERGLPILRPLFLNYPAEPETYALSDEYLLGDDLLVAPVLQPGQTERRVYLPTGQWRDYWTGNIHTGPGWTTVPAPLHHIPLFVREGSALPLPVPAELMK
jgi:alpha-D-xyloside xylohydrolase